MQCYKCSAKARYDVGKVDAMYIGERCIGDSLNVCDYHRYEHASHSSSLGVYAYSYGPMGYRKLLHGRPLVIPI